MLFQFGCPTAQYGPTPVVTWLHFKRLDHAVDRLLFLALLPHDAGQETMVTHIAWLGRDHAFDFCTCRIQVSLLFISFREQPSGLAPVLVDFLGAAKRINFADTITASCVSDRTVDPHFRQQRKSFTRFIGPLDGFVVLLRITQVTNHDRPRLPQIGPCLQGRFQSFLRCLCVESLRSVVAVCQQTITVVCLAFQFLVDKIQLFLTFFLGLTATHQRQNRKLIVNAVAHCRTIVLLGRVNLVLFL